MRLKILTLVAATALLAACSHKNEEAASTAATTQAAPPPQTTMATVSPADELKNTVGDRIFFDFDKSDIKSEGTATLTRQAAFAEISAVDLYGRRALRRSWHT